MNTLIITATAKSSREKLQAVVSEMMDECAVTITSGPHPRYFFATRLTARFHNLHHEDITNIKAHLGDEVSYQLI